MTSLPGVEFARLRFPGHVFFRCSVRPSSRDLRNDTSSAPPLSQYYSSAFLSRVDVPWRLCLISWENPPEPRCDAAFNFSENLSYLRVPGNLNIFITNYPSTTPSRNCGPTRSNILLRLLSSGMPESVNIAFVRCIVASWLPAEITAGDEVCGLLQALASVSCLSMHCLEVALSCPLQPSLRGACRRSSHNWSEPTFFESRYGGNKTAPRWGSIRAHG